MKNKESFSFEPKKEEEKFIPYILTKEQRDTNPNGLWESFLNGAITTIKNSVNEGAEENTVRAKLAKAIKEDLSKERRDMITVDDILLIGLQNFEHEHGGSWGKTEQKWKDVYCILGEKTEKKENLAEKDEREALMSEIERGLAQEDWNSVYGYIEDSLKTVPGLGSVEYGAFREKLLEKFNEMQSPEG